MESLFANNANDNPLLEKKMEILISMSHKKLETELNSIKEALRLIASEIEGIKTNISSIKDQPKEQVMVQPLQQEATSQAAEDKPKVFAEVHDSKPVPHQPHPRLGNYNTEDVSIEKFFYFGGKR